MAKKKYEPSFVSCLSLFQEFVELLEEELSES